MDKSSKWSSIKDRFYQSPLQNQDNIRQKTIKTKSPRTPSTSKLKQFKNVSKNVDNIIISDSDEENIDLSLTQVKRPKQTIVDHSEDENSIGNYDPDYDDINTCRGCFKDSSNIDQNLVIISATAGSVRSTEKIKSTSRPNVWSSLSKPFKSRQDEIIELEQSILDDDSNDEPAKLTNNPPDIIIDDEIVECSQDFEPGSKKFDIDDESNDQPGKIINNSPDIDIDETPECSQATKADPVGQIYISQSTSNSTNTNVSIESYSSPDATTYSTSNISPIEKRRRKPAKGSQEERLAIILNKSKSNFAFWQNDRRSNLVSQGEIVQIEKIENSYGRSLVYGLAANGDKIVFCIDPDSKLLRRLRDNNTGMLKKPTLEIQFEANGYLLCGSDNVIAYPFLEKVL